MKNLAVITPIPTLFLLFVICGTTSSYTAAAATDTLTPGTPLADGDTLISATGTFALGFFTPANSNTPRRYVGIWYHKMRTQTVVWVANRQNPVIGSGGILALTPDGTLLISQSNSTILWSSASRTAANPLAHLLDSGDFVVDDNNGGYIWRSFDHPTDKLLPGMKLGWDLKAGLSRNLTAWAGPSDPSPGKYTLFIDPHGEPQLVLANNNRWVWRGGPWNGVSFVGGYAEAASGAALGFNFTFISNEAEVYYMTLPVANNSVPSYLYADSSGIAGRSVWHDNETHIGYPLERFASLNSRWNPYWEAPHDPCDFTGVCGAYGVCNANDIPMCSCLQGFEPVDAVGWELRDATQGCRRMTGLDCSNSTDGFVVVAGTKLPNTAAAMVDMRKNLEQCREWCLMNCSCEAYTAADVSAARNGGGCVIWTAELKDLRVLVEAGHALYVRLAAADLDSVQEFSLMTIIEIAVSLLLVSALSCAVVICIWKQKRKKRVPCHSFRDPLEFNACNFVNCGQNETVELSLFDMDIIEAATNYFSIQNKLGEGGFGPVYMGKFKEGQEIAVKRLAKTSTQGIDEFKNEVTLIAKLQHRNLVRLLGCCIEGDERLIIYEYMPNKSLDVFLFDKQKKVLLDWQTRYLIILGIARGLLYLHQDSRLTIVHRDLKASNILLDNEMNPKISDFGMARIFGGDETGVNTTKIVGTYGYMSPEYAMDGIFSVKSDVFSFGVLVLEIISGRRNRGIYLVEHHSNIVCEAWNLWIEERELELVDDSIRQSISAEQVSKCIKLALLCVQEQPEDRPSMSSVVLLLCSDIALLPDPIQPCFISTSRHSIDDDLYLGRHHSRNASDITITVEGR